MKKNYLTPIGPRGFAHDTHGSLFTVKKYGTWQPSDEPSLWRPADEHDRRGYAWERKRAMMQRRASVALSSARLRHEAAWQTALGQLAYEKHLKRLAKKSRANRSR